MRFSPHPVRGHPLPIGWGEDLAERQLQRLRIAWVTRSFLDYRVPVYAALDELAGGGLHLLYSGDYVPERVQEKVRQRLGDRAIGLRGEWKLGPEDQFFMANRNLSLRFQPGLLSRIRSLRPEVLVCDGFFKWTFPALLYRIRHGTPLVILYERTAHTERRAQWFRTVYRKLALKFTDAMSCNGRLCKEYTESLGLPADRITTGHMAADVASMERGARSVEPREIKRLRAEWGAQGVLFICVGRLHPRKGCMELLTAWRAFEEQGRDRGTLLFVGEGDEEEKMRAYCQAHQLTNVRFAGAVEYDQIIRYYKASDVFIIPTLEDNWSLVVPEAMACGLPILCSKYNGCWPELVQAGRNGWVFDPFDPQDIVRCLRECIDSSLTPALNGENAIMHSSLAVSPTRRFAGSRLEAMGEQSREILKDHTPRKAAEAIYRACQIAVEHRAKLQRPSPVD